MVRVSDATCNCYHRSNWTACSDYCGGAHISAREAYACSYPAPPPMTQVLEGADLAFVGEVISIDRQEIKSDDYRTFEDIIEFRTSEVWKGEPYETMFVKRTWLLTPPSPSSSCPPDPSFAKGARYIVFVWNGRTHLSVNSPTQQFSYTLEDEIASLGAGKTPIPGSVSPIPERVGQPVEEQSGGGCGLTPSYAVGSVNLSGIGLTAMLAWLWIRRRIRR